MNPHDRLLAVTLDLTQEALEKGPLAEGFIVERQDLGLTPSGWSRCYMGGRSFFRLRSECHAVMDANGPENTYRIVPLVRSGPIETFPATAHQALSRPPRTLSRLEEQYRMDAEVKRRVG